MSVFHVAAVKIAAAFGRTMGGLVTDENHGQSRKSILSKMLSGLCIGMIVRRLKRVRRLFYKATICKQLQRLTLTGFLKLFPGIGSHLSRATIKSITLV